MQICEAFARDFSKFKILNAQLIESMNKSINLMNGEDLAVFHFDMANDIKSQLGIKASNSTFDEETQTEREIRMMDDWFTAHVSNVCEVRETVALSLWFNGPDMGRAVLAEFMH